MLMVWMSPKNLDEAVTQLHMTFTMGDSDQWKPIKG